MHLRMVRGFTWLNVNLRNRSKRVDLLRCGIWSSSLLVGSKAALLRILRCESMRLLSKGIGDGFESLTVRFVR